MTTTIAGPGSVAKLNSGLELSYNEAVTGYSLVLFHGDGPSDSGLSNYQNNYKYFAR